MFHIIFPATVVLSRRLLVDSSALLDIIYPIPFVVFSIKVIVCSEALFSTVHPFALVYDFLFRHASHRLSDQGTFSMHLALPEITSILQILARKIIDAVTLQIFAFFSTGVVVSIRKIMLMILNGATSSLVLRCLSSGCCLSWGSRLLWTYQKLRRRYQRLSLVWPRQIIASLNIESVSWIRRTVWICCWDNDVLCGNIRPGSVMSHLFTFDDDLLLIRRTFSIIFQAWWDNISM